MAFANLDTALDEKRPNILLILIDDLGYGDLSAYGHPWLKTPRTSTDFTTRAPEWRISWSAQPVNPPVRR